MFNYITICTLFQYLFSTYQIFILKVTFNQERKKAARKTGPPESLTKYAQENARRNSRTDNACNVRTHSVHEQEVGGVCFLTNLL